MNSRSTRTATLDQTTAMCRPCCASNVRLLLSWRPGRLRTRGGSCREVRSDMVRGVWYPNGEVCGYSRGEDISVPILRDSQGLQVPCQGVKICPNVDLAIVSQPHMRATQETLRQTLASDREIYLQHTSPSRDVFEKTAALIAALRKEGCPAPRQEDTLFDSDEEEVQEARQEYQVKHWCGYVPKFSHVTASSSVHIVSTANPSSSMSCPQKNVITPEGRHTKTIISMRLLGMVYNAIYLGAIFDGDEEEIESTENAAVELGFGPRVDCTTFYNNLAQIEQNQSTYTLLLNYGRIRQSPPTYRRLPSTSGNSTANRDASVSNLSWRIELIEGIDRLNG
ncbi:hypothetical protein K438DRAFT_1775793 [Mycena galopus ATCC 62051]|nr:hypothetical protein K438DRAFT_1775793 [Mycena galopus ATCC 62051]